MIVEKLCFGVNRDFSLLIWIFIVEFWLFNIVLKLMILFWVCNCIIKYLATFVKHFKICNVFIFVMKTIVSLYLRDCNYSKEHIIFKNLFFLPIVAFGLIIFHFLLVFVLIFIFVILFWRRRKRRINLFLCSIFLAGLILALIKRLENFNVIVFIWNLRNNRFLILKL